MRGSGQKAYCLGAVGEGKAKGQRKNQTRVLQVLKKYLLVLAMEIKCQRKGASFLVNDFTKYFGK